MNYTSKILNWFRRRSVPGNPSSDIPISQAEFDSAWYLRINHDVRAAGIDPWKHFIEYGYREGRLPAPIRAFALDHILWRGFHREAEAELRLILRGDNRMEVAAAGWVLARYAATQNQWHKARSAIKKFYLEPAGAIAVRHPGPWLLAILAEVYSGNIDAARQVLKKAKTLFPGHKDLVLAELEVIVASVSNEQGISVQLSNLYEGSKLVPLALRPGTSSRFDRLFESKPPVAVSDGPLVSVIIPAYEAEETIGTCLRGLTRQSWRKLEIIVVDDFSKDQTAQLVAAAAENDPRIRLIRQDRNGGAYIARNTGLAAARGSFVTVHDADDWSHPQKIERQVVPLIENPALQATFSHMVRVRNDLRMALWRIETGWIYRNTSSLMIRAELRESLGYWDRVRAGADTEYYHRLRAAFGEDSIQEVQVGVPLSFARTSQRSLTMQPGTHLASQFAGPRRQYMESANNWIRQQVLDLDNPDDCGACARVLKLPKEQAQRYFLAPVQLGPADPFTPPDNYSRIAESPFFDPAWYLRRHTDILTEDVDPVRHYLDFGSKEDRDAGPLFPTDAWRALHLAAAEENPLLELQRLGLDMASLPRFPGALRKLKSPKVLVFAHAADRQIFGAERSLLTSLERLAAGKDGVAYAPVVVLPSGVNSEYIDEIRARAHTVEFLPQVWRHRFRKAPTETVEAIREMIRRYRPAAVHVNTLVLDSPLIASRLERCESVLHVRELPDQDPDLCRILGDSAVGLRRRILRQSDRFIANSQNVADWIDCPERCVVWDNQVDNQLFELPFSPQGRLRVALISSNIAKKGIADFVHVAKQVERISTQYQIPSEQGFRFILIGPYTSDLDALGELPSNVEMAGYAPDPVSAMRQCDIVLVLSHFAESFGRTALEALAAGRPVICYDRGTPPQFVISNDAGIVVPTDQTEEVSKALISLQSDRKRLSDMSRRARAAAKRYSEYFA